MVNKLLKIANRVYGDIVIIDDSLTIKDIYDLVELCWNISNNKLDEEELNFIAHLSINDLPKPTNASEQIKYINIYNLITVYPG
ncbi:MAG: hypothetical protein ACI32Z_07915 [Clostridium sp.]